MDAQIKELKTKLRETINRVLHAQNYIQLKEQCLDVTSYLSVFKLSVQSAIQRNNLIMLYQKFLTDLESGSIHSIQKNINELIKNAAYSLTLPLAPVLGYLQECIQNAQNYNIIHLSKIIGYVVGCSLFESIKTQTNFNTCWDLTLESTFVAFNLIHRGNKFLKDYLALQLCDHINQDYFMQIAPLKIVEVGNTIFGDVRNFKFFKKACILYQNFQLPEARSITISDPNNNLPDSPNEISIICSHISKARESNQDILKVGQKFVVNPSGYQNSKRIDHMVLFGKHPLCDIRLPDDDQLDDIAFAIYHNNNTFIIIDCSKKAHLKRKIQPSLPLKVREGMIIDIAYSSLMKIAKIQFGMNEETGDVTSEVHYEFLKGELFGAFGEKIRRFSNVRRNGEIKNTFLVGKGAYGVEPDLRLSEGGCVSGKHMEFEFKRQEWFLTDLESKNGTFILMKNHDQYNDKIPSFPTKLFENVQDGEYFDTIALDRYSFVIQREVNQ